MCYSAQLLAAYDRYVREFGAEMDIEQFAVEYGFKPYARIPRAVDRWFRDGPVREAIRRRNAEIVAGLEAEIFKQRRRLAAAERSLKAKVTKAASENQRIATSKIEASLRRLALYQGDAPAESDARIFPFYFAPIILQDGARRVVRLARYHCRQAGKPEAIDRKYPGLYNARRDNLERFWRGQFGATHAVMLVESFYENVEREGRNRVLHFVPRPAGTMLVACLYSEWTDPKDGRTLLSFAAITDEPPPEVAAAGHDRMIVSLRPENLEAWLTPAWRSAEELQRILSDREPAYYEHELAA